MSVGLGAMKQPLAVVTRTCRRLLREPYRARRGDAIPYRSVHRTFEVADAADVRACDVRCPTAAHDQPEPSSTALEAPVCFVAPLRRGTRL